MQVIHLAGVLFLARLPGQPDHRPATMAQDFGARFREAFAADLATDPAMTLRQGDAIDSYGQAPPAGRAADTVTDVYLEQFHWGMPHLDPASWRHYLPALADFAQRHVRSNHNTVGTLISSLRPPDRDPPRLASLTAAQEALVREFLEMLAFSPESAWQAEACQALEEWWVENPLYRAKAGRTGAP
jgi:hypothetical protein